VGEWLSQARTNAVRATVLTYSNDADLQRLLAEPQQAASKRIDELQREVEGCCDSDQAGRCSRRSARAAVRTRRCARRSSSR
jgi:hypothetical protein